MDLGGRWGRGVWPKLLRRNQAKVQLLDLFLFFVPQAGFFQPGD